MNIGKNLFTSGKKITIIFLILFSTFAFSNEKIVFGLTGTVYKGDLKTFKEWEKYLEKKLDINIELRFSRTYAEMMTLLDVGTVDIAYVCNSTYIKLKEKDNVKLLSSPISNGKQVYYSYIISKQEKLYTKLIDFENKLFAFTDPGSTSGYLAPNYELLKKGYKIENFFSHLIYTYEHGESIKAVLEDFVDGASVDSLVYEQFAKRFPNEAAKLKIVEKLGPFPMSPLVTKKALNEELFKKIQNSFLNMHKDKEGETILKDLSLDKLALPKDDFKKIEEIMNFIEKR